MISCIVVCLHCFQLPQNNFVQPGRRGLGEDLLQLGQTEPGLRKNIFIVVVVVISVINDPSQRARMFEVAGKHTFFFPVDAAFEVRVLLL